MKENIKEILLQYKKRIDEIQNNNVEFKSVEAEIEKLVEERNQKKEELKQYSTDDFFYDETQENIKSIQEEIDEKNLKNKELKANINQEMKNIQQEIIDKMQTAKTELNNQLKKDKEEKEKLVAEINSYEERQQDFEKRNRRHLELHGKEIQLSKAALEHEEEKRQEIEGKRKLVAEIDDRRESSRDIVKEYNDIIKIASDKSFDSIQKCIDETSIEAEKEETIEYPDMEEEWTKHVADPYKQEEIEQQINQAYEEKRAQEKIEAEKVNKESKEDIESYLENGEKELVQENKVEKEVESYSMNGEEWFVPKQENEKKTLDKEKGPTDLEKMNIVISAKDEIIRINGKEYSVDFEEVLSNKKEMFKRLDINNIIKAELDTKNIFTILKMRREMDPVLVEALSRYESNPSRREKILSDYIGSIARGRIGFVNKLASIEYDLEDNIEENNYIDKQMQKYGRFANKIIGFEVKGLKDRGFKALFKNVMNKVKIPRLPWGRGERESENVEEKKSYFDKVREVYQDTKEVETPEIFENKFTERDVKNSFVPLADAHTKAKLNEISRQYAAEQENAIPNLAIRKEDVKVTTYGGKKVEESALKTSKVYEDDELTK